MAASALICSVAILLTSALELSGARRGALTRPSAHMQRTAARPKMNGDLEALFTDEPPPSWASPEWKWGYADGEAHNVAMRVRGEYSKPHRRSALLSYARLGSVDFLDLKMALALKCQRARNLGYDEADRRWESLMEELAACEFESGDGDAKLKDAINKRLPTPVDTHCAGTIAEALDHLGFFEKGL